MEKQLLSIWIFRIGLLLLIVVLGTIMDWAIHSLSPAFYVPLEYYRNKVLFGVGWSLVGLFFYRWLGIKRAEYLALAIFFTVAVFLQAKYFLQGYDLFFVILFLFLHFFMFFIPGVIIFRRYKIFFEQ